MHNCLSNLFWKMAPETETCVHPSPERPPWTENCDENCLMILILTFLEKENHENIYLENPCYPDLEHLLMIL